MKKETYVTPESDEIEIRIEHNFVESPGNGEQEQPGGGYHGPDD